MKNSWFWFFVFLAILLRILLIANPGFEADVAFWKSWGLAAADKGIVEGLRITNNNYPTPFSYVLAAMVNVYRLIASPYNFNEFWDKNNLLFLTVAKLPSILADFGIAAIILWIGRNAKRIGFPSLPSSGYWLLVTGYLLNPVGLIDGAWWGQVDSLGVFIYLIAFLLTLKRWPFWAGAVFMAAMMTKLQNMIYGPLFFLFIWQTLGYEGLIKAVAGALLSFFGLNIEFFATREAGRVLGSLTDNFDYFPWMSLNAFNVWWIVSGAKGMQVSDKLLAIGVMNAKTVGLIMFSSVYLFALLRQLLGANSIATPALPVGRLLHGHSVNKKNNITMQQFNNVTIEDQAHKYHIMRYFLESLIMVNAAFFLFQTQSHDRYAFPLSVFPLLWSVFLIDKVPSSNQGIVTWLHGYIAENKRFRLFTIFYLLFTLSYFYNLHTALVFNYPDNGLPLLSAVTQPIFTITTSIVLIGLFFIFLLSLLRRTPKTVIIVTTAFFLTVLAAGNLPLITKNPISLTSFKPFTYRQGYGSLMVNMPANASVGYDKWSPLSVQYAFYRRGLGTHAPSVIEYDLGKHFRKFSTDYGIDTQAGAAGTAVFEIYGDGKLLFRSETMGRYIMPRHAEVNITGVKTLGLVTTDAGDGKNDDHTDWLRPTLWP